MDIAKNLREGRLMGQLDMARQLAIDFPEWPSENPFAEPDIQKSDMSATGAVQSMTAPKGNIQKAEDGEEEKKQSKIAHVMREFAAGKLKSSSGEPVTDQKQALAIAYSYFKSDDLEKAVREVENILSKI